MTVFWLTGACIGGIVLASVAGQANPGFLWATTLLLFSSWLLLRKTNWEAGIILSATALLGFMLANLALSPPDDPQHIVRFANDSHQVLEGRLQNLSTYPDGHSRFDLVVNRVWRGSSVAQASGRVRVSVGQGLVTVQEGQLLRLRVRLRRPRNFGCPGEFDSTGHLASQQIFVTTFIKDANQIVPIVETMHPKRARLSGLRTIIARHIDQNVVPDDAGLVKALLIGTRDGVTPEQRKRLSEGGVSHLFAISGLHFGLLGLLLYLATRRLYCCSTRLMLWCPPRRILPLLLIVPMGCYLLLTGNALPTRRAFCMATLAGLLYSSNRRTPALQLLATTAFLILLYQPLALFRPAFQLSFAGLFGILFWMPTWQKWVATKPGWLRWPATILLTTLAATIATAPLVLWHFHLFAPAGLPANLLATPLIAWGALPVGLFGVFLLPLAPQYADFCFSGSGALVAMTMALVETVSRLPGLIAWHYFPGWRDLLALLLLSGGLLLRKKIRYDHIVCTGFLFVGIFLLLIRPGGSPALQIVALSVGQGDATVLSLRGKDHYLVDGGGLPGGRFDTGERLVAPALGRLHIRHLRGVILTHDHPDHRDGLRFILNTFPVDRFYSGIPLAELDPLLRTALRRHQIPVTCLPQGWSHLTAPAGASLEIFTPAQTDRDKNERSLVVYAGQTKDGVLLTGDMGPAGLRQLLHAGLPGPVTLFKLPHHGSRRPSPASYLSNIMPQAAFVSVGRHNVYHLPSTTTLHQLEQADIPLFRTDQQGTLIFRSNDHGWRTSTSPDRLFD